MKIAYLGPMGSFSYLAAKSAFPEAELLAQATIIEAISVFETGKVDFAIIPIENSIEGAVNASIDYIFHRTQVTTVAELILPISQNLLVTDSTKPVETVFSHAHALAQVRVYLREHYPLAKLERMESTALASKFVAEHPNQNFAAIAPLSAAETYHLQVLAENIQDIADNNTRFWVLGQSIPAFQQLQQVSQKTTLTLTLPDNLPGALHKAISTFAWRGINMTRIESRPLRTTLGEYYFIIDLESDPNITYAIEELQSLAVTVRLLGAYSVYQL